MYKTLASALSNVGFAIPNNKACMFQEGWSATLSYKTRMSLRNQGFPV